MLAVAFSGIAGRYLYAQIPQSLSAAKTSFQELEANEDALADALKRQTVYSKEKIAPDLRHAVGRADSQELAPGGRSGK